MTRLHFPRLLPLVLAALVCTSAQDARANCDVAPTGTFGNAWWTAFKSWCRGCGGTICDTYNQCDGRCTPGPNWAGKGGSTAAGGYKLDSPARGGGGGGPINIPVTPGMSAQQAFTAGLVEGFLNEAFKPEDPAAAQRRREAEEAARVRRAQLAAEEAARVEREHKALEGELKLSDDRAIPEPSLKRDGGTNVADADIAIKREGDEGTPMLLRDGTPETGARGHRIVDCKKTRETHDRIVKGLTLTRSIVWKTDSQLKEAKAAAAGARADRSKTLQDAVRGEVKQVAQDALGSTRKIRLKLQKLELAGKVDAKLARRLFMNLDVVDTTAENVKKLGKSAKAGAEYGTQLNKAASSLSEEVAAANRLFVESGIAEEVGEGLAKAGFGPMGALAFRAAKTSIEVGSQTGLSMISEEEAERAAKNLEIMRDQLSKQEAKVVELGQDLAELCK